MRTIILACMGALLLSGCAAFTPGYAPNIVPAPGHEAEAAADKKFCDDQVAARAKAHRFTWNSAKKIASGGGQGIGSNAGLGAAGILGPLLGGAGGAMTSALKEAEITDNDSAATLQSCLLQKRADDHSFVLVEPVMGGNQP